MGEGAKGKLSLSMCGWTGGASKSDHGYYQLRLVDQLGFVDRYTLSRCYDQAKTLVKSLKLTSTYTGAHKIWHGRQVWLQSRDGQLSQNGKKLRDE